MEEEIWKDVPNYEGWYEVSNLGNVKSVDRTFMCKDGKIRHFKSRIMSKVNGGGGYLTVSLCKIGNYTTMRIHQIVAMAFLGHNPNGIKTVIDHINGIKTDNRVENLEVVTHRENISRGYRNKDTRSRFTGVRKNGNKWEALIYFKGKYHYLGAFGTDSEASACYEKAKNRIEEYGEL